MLNWPKQTTMMRFLLRQWVWLKTNYSPSLWHSVHEELKTTTDHSRSWQDGTKTRTELLSVAEDTAQVQDLQQKTTGVSNRQTQSAATFRCHSGLACSSDLAVTHVTDCSAWDHRIKSHHVQHVFIMKTTVTYSQGCGLYTITAVLRSSNLCGMPKISTSFLRNTAWQ